jgi:hypothetical protein
MTAMSRGPRYIYQQGDHVCTLFSSPEEQLAAAVEYIEQGLVRGERCLYVCGEHTLEGFRQALAEAGIDVAQEEERGALVLLTKEHAHLAGGSFSPARMIGILRKAVEDALAEGYSGLCAAGDMTWLLDEAPGSEQIAEYEALLNGFYKSHKALGLCQYNRTRLPPAILDHGIATHPTVRLGGSFLLSNPFYELPEAAMRRTPDPAGVDARIARLESAAQSSF